MGHFRRAAMAGVACACLPAGIALGQTAGQVLPEIEVRAGERGAAGPERAATRPAGTGETQAPNAASETLVTGDRVQALPLSRPGEVVEVVPGLIVTQHSGEGKANQYFLRGFNLDHGTDLAITVDGMPVNMRTHGHGQGYADLNFLIPELVASARVRKGPYFASEGDFASAGSVKLDLLDGLPKNLAQMTIGSFGYRRGLAIISQNVAQGRVFVAAEGTTYDGPWKVGDNLRKFNGVVRYSQGDNNNGFSITGMAYGNNWTSTDQIAARAIPLIGRFGTLDPTDGGVSSRFSLSTRWSRSDAQSASRIEAYAIRSTMQLFSNFTYFLNDPINGDQFRQYDRRTLLGVNLSHTFKSDFMGRRMENEVGFQGRFDDIGLGLNNTAQQRILSTVRADQVRQSSAGVYIENRIWWTNWLRTIAGLRGDVFAANVQSDTALNSGRSRDSIASPKFGVVFGPFWNTEFFVNAGRGFHSNDARGTTISVDPVDKVTPLARTPFLVRAQGAEVGLRFRPWKNFESTVALFGLDFKSENLFIGDAGTTEASRPSRRVGVEWTNHWKPYSWLSFDVDFAMTRARFTDFDPAGAHIPGAPRMVVAAGFTYGEAKGWFGGAKLRYFGPRPLIEDNSQRSKGTGLVSVRAGYRFDNGVRLQLDAHNILGSKSSQIDYFYESRLPGEPAAGIADRHTKPVEPLAMRLTLAGEF